MLVQEIKNRITNVQSIRKITHAVELVATSKLYKVKRNFESSKNYFEIVNDTYNKIFASIKNLQQVMEIDQTKPNLYLIITSDYGLCGSYNSNVLKSVTSLITKNDQLVIIGTKAINHFKSLDYEVVYQIDQIGDNIQYQQLHDLISLISNKFLAREIKNIFVASMQYVNSISFHAKLWPIFDFEDLIPKSQTQTFEFEPNPQSVLLKTLPLYIGAMIYGKVVESKVSETAMRRIAMESASDNADDLISNLSIKYNEARQASITQEIIEIITGSEVH